MRRTLALFAAAAALIAAPDLHAQELPDGWAMRFDRPSAGADMVDLRVMEPGWHVTTGRAGAGIFWQPGMTADGPFSFSTGMHLFDPASHAEAFGLFVGGQNLEAADQRYVYFLVRQTGEYLIKRRVGSETEDVVGWTAHAAIPEMAPGAEESTEYQLAIEVSGDEVAFMVNGAVVHTLSTDAVDASGQVGIRVNHMLDLHIEQLELTRSGM